MTIVNHLHDWLARSVAETEDAYDHRRRPRRYRGASEREAAAQQTRERILSAAVAEFGAKGYSGARTAAIASRAGVNQQLIAYYFGGKRGLLDELRSRWRDRQKDLVAPEASFSESMRAYMDATLDDADWARLVVWRALGDDPAVDDADEVRRSQVQLGVQRIRDRQRAGELTETISAEFVTLLSYLIAFAPVSMPDVVTEIVGVDPLSTEYRTLVVDQLATLLRRDDTG